MKKAIALICLFFFLTVLKAQIVINDPNAEVRPVGAFTGIEVSSGIDLYVSGGGEALAVSASKPIHRAHIKTVIDKGILKVTLDAGNWGFQLKNSKKPRVYVSFSTLKSLEASGGATIIGKGVLAVPELSLRLSGGADFRGTLEVDKLVVRQSGGSDVQVAGKANLLRVDASGGSNFHGYELKADVGEVEASGACLVKVAATGKLTARASGASDIRYKGKPVVQELKSSGASSIKEG